MSIYLSIYLLLFLYWLLEWPWVPLSQRYETRRVLLPELSAF